jgi:predicted nucleic acid-binding protein
VILVDTSIWIDHLHSAEPDLEAALAADAVAVHPLVIEELAAGSIARRAEMLAWLSCLRRCPVLSHSEALHLIDRERLWGRGLSPADIHLIGSARLAGWRLWTRDKRLATAADAVGVALH